MSLHQTVPEPWRYALLAGLPVAPIALWGYVQSGSSIELSGLGLFALVAGYLAKRAGLDATPVGFRAGLVATAPVTVWAIADLGWFISGLAQPLWVTAVQGLMLLFVAGLSLVFGALTGAVAARVGGWLAEQNGHPRGAAPA